MLVSRSTFDAVLTRLKACSVLGVDTETTGLRMFHGDRLFSIIFATSAVDAFYFNFWPSYGPALRSEYILGTEHLEKLKTLFSDPRKIWRVHKANFDGHVLAQDGLEIAGTIHCTQSIGRVEYNEHHSYDLADSLTRIGLKKDDAVEKWITNHGAEEDYCRPGKKAKETRKFFYKVPPDIIVPYGLDDARGTFALGEHQEASIRAQSDTYPHGVPCLSDILATERRLTSTVLRMERTGVRVDRPYIKRAAAFERDRTIKTRAAFKAETLHDFVDSDKLYQKLFQSERDKWQYTKKGNPSFSYDVIKYFDNHAAKLIVQLRDSENKERYYLGLDYFADANGDVHAQFNSGSARTGRFGSSGPNMHGMAQEDGADQLAQEFVVRRAVIPRPGYLFILPDWRTMEYNMMLDYSKHMMIKHFIERELSWDEGYFEIANKVLAGFDIHQALADVMKCSRGTAKTLNFMILYGCGAALLALTLRISVEAAEKLISDYYAAMPYVRFMMKTIQGAIKTRGWVRNWAGRKYSFPDRGKAFIGPNTVIQGGCADVCKIAMNRLDELFLSMRSRMVLSIHDELPCEIHESEVHTAPKLVHEAMMNIYPHKYIPLTVDMEWSDKNLADKVKGYPA